MLQGSGRVQLVGVGLLSPGAVTAAMVVYDFCGDLGPLCGSVAVLETGTDCVGWLVYWLAGRLADWLVGPLRCTRQRMDSKQGGVCGHPLPAHLVVFRCWIDGLLGLFCFTSCCSAVSLPPRSSPRPGPCGSHVWGSESCGC